MQRHAPNTNNKTSLWTFMSFGNSMGIGHNRLLFCTLNKAVNSTHRRPSLGRTFALHVIDACGNTKTMDEVSFCGLNDRRSGCYSVGGPLEDRDHPSFLNNNLDLGGFEKQVRQFVYDYNLVIDLLLAYENISNMFLFYMRLKFFQSVFLFSQDCFDC